MKIAPLIHSRTFEVDFNSKFAVRPDDFTDSDIEWAREKILPSTQDLNILNDVRFVVASKGGKCFAGVACMLDLFAEKFLSADERAYAENFFCDNRGRYIKLFLGFVIKNSTANKIPDVMPSDLWQMLWQMFKEYLAPEWNRKAPETVLAPYRDIREKSFASSKPPKPAQIFQGVELYEMSSAVNEKLFDEYLAIALKKNLAFCANLDRAQPIEDKIYQAVTTTADIINRLREKQRQLDAEAAQKKNQPAVQRDRRSTDENYEINTSQLYDGKEIVTVAEFVNRLNAIGGGIILVDELNNRFELKTFGYRKFFNKIIFDCEVKQIG